jgi:hypothetical protein
MRRIVRALSRRQGIETGAEDAQLLLPGGDELSEPVDFGVEGSAGIDLASKPARTLWRAAR